jgi:uncharacterized protein (TIRG00374 family)
MFNAQSDHLLKAAFYGGAIFSFVSVALFAFLLLLVWKKNSIRAFTERRWAKHKSAIVDKFLRICHSFIEGAAALQDVRILIVSAAYSFVIWIVIGIGLWLSLKAMALPVSLSGTFILLPLLVIGIAIPTPGGVGTYHEAMQLGLIGLFQIPRDFAISTAIVVHAITIVPVIILGFIFLWKDGLTFRAVSHIENMASSTKN